ncbi:Bug family tripartite tricarboxylate transporter substrate binding protein [Devosia sp. A449]
MLKNVSKLMIGLALCAMAAPGVAAQDDYPNRTISLVVSYTPGGGTDTLARLFADRVTQSIGQKVIVDNRPGANGNVGTDAVAGAEPDGYMLLLGNFGPMAVNPVLYPDMASDPAEALQPVTQLAAAPLAILVNAEVPANSLAEFIEYAKSRPGELSFASAGAGTSNQLGAELLNMVAGLDILHIPYRGAAQAMTAVVSGEVEMFVAPLPSAMPHLESGTVRALALTGPERSPVLPELATTAELGFGDIAITTWYGILVPKNTPETVVSKLQEEFAGAARAPEMVKWLQNDGGATPIGSTPDEFGAFIAAEREKWAAVVEAAGITIE